MEMSSRTPGGQLNNCPICMAHVAIEPEILIGDVSCPQCGQLLWFIQIADTALFFDADQTLSKKVRALTILSKRLGIDAGVIENNPLALREFGIDSLGLVELAVELEEELDR